MEILTKGVYMRLLQEVKLGDLFIETERKLGNKRWLTRANGLQLLNAGKQQRMFCIQFAFIVINLMM